MLKLYEISEKLCNNMFFLKIIIKLRRTKFAHFRHIFIGHYDAKRNASKIAEFKNSYNDNKKYFDEVYSLLEDNESKITYKSILEFRMSCNYSKIKNSVYFPQYFVKEIFRNYNDEIFVDGGHM